MTDTIVKEIKSAIDSVPRDAPINLTINFYTDYLLNPSGGGAKVNFFSLWPFRRKHGSQPQSHNRTGDT